ncbi:MAG: CinA family protein [Pseudomonadota bacterium]
MTATEVLDAAKAAGLKIVTAESCTGGMVAAALTDIAGSSAAVECGFVTYSNEAKKSLLDVSSEALKSYGAVSEEVALEMAEGALRKSLADVSVSITGIAGPGPSDFKPEGRVCFGLARTGWVTRTETVEFGAPGRAEVRRKSRDHALSLLLWAITRDP